jgi:hypothetical protein
VGFSDRANQHIGKTVNQKRTLCAYALMLLCTYIIMLLCTYAPMCLQEFRQLSRVLYKSALFMQNEPNPASFSTSPGQVLPYCVKECKFFEITRLWNIYRIRTSQFGVAYGYAGQGNEPKRSQFRLAPRFTLGVDCNQKLLLKYSGLPSSLS